MKTRTVKILGIGAVVLMVSLMLMPAISARRGRPAYVTETKVILRGNAMFVFQYYSNGSILIKEYVNILGRIHGNRAYGYDFRFVGSTWIHPAKLPFIPQDDFFGVPPHTIAPLV